jgi:acetoin utilization deacetylase AcuC-like enzyme
VYISIHGHPSFTYPSITGWEEEKGEGKGLNCNFNHPLPPGTDGSTYLETVDRVTEEILACKPDIILISVGFDTYREDPISHFRLEKEDMRLMAEKLAALKLPSLIVQEGGYCLQELGNLARAFLTPFTTI